MKSLRDLVKKMPETRNGLEAAVMQYSPSIREALAAHPEYRDVVEKEVGASFDRFSGYMGGLTQKMSAAGHAVGYTADAWLATGDIVGSLGGQFIDLLLQVPDKAYGLVYAARTGDYLGALQNIGQGMLSYIPGFTVFDEGLSRIVQKRMVKDAAYNVEQRLGIGKAWPEKAAASIAGDYDGVVARIGNVVSPRKKAA